MIKTSERILELCILVSFINTLPAEQIDWVNEAFKSASVFSKEYDQHLTGKLVHDNMAPGFVKITPRGILEGDFDALEKQLTNLEHKGHFIRGPPQVVMTCGNTALVWRNATFYDKDDNRKDGTQVILYEYTDGSAKEKLFHSSI